MNVGKAEVELLRSTQEGSSDRNSLARFMIGGLWVSYRMIYGGESLAIQLHLHEKGLINTRVEDTSSMTTKSCVAGLNLQTAVVNGHSALDNKAACSEMLNSRTA